MGLIPTGMFNLRVSNFHGDEYNTLFFECPDLDDVREVLEFEIYFLKHQAHQYDDVEMTDEIEFRVACCWNRVTELQNLLSLIQVAPPPEEYIAPYRIEVQMADRPVGSIDVIEVPAYARAPPVKV